MEDTITEVEIEYPNRTVFAFVGNCWFPGCSHTTYPIFNKDACKKTLAGHVLRTHRKRK